MKKVLSLVLALVFVLALAVNAFAATGINVSADPKKVNPGETFVVTVKLENDIPLSEGATMMQGELKYDEEVLDFVSVEKISEDLNSAKKHKTDAKVVFSYLDVNDEVKAFSKGELIKATFKVKDTVSSSVHLNTVLKFNAYVQNRAGEDVADITFNKETKILVTAGEHSWNAGEVTTEPTCSKAGVRTFTCTFEGCGATKTEEEPATKNHTPKEAVKENEKAATCKETGSYDEVVYCSVCNGEISRTAVTVPVTNNHSPKEAVKENEKAATCKDDGSYDEVVYCSVCDKEISRTTVTVSATGEHVYEKEVERVEATCDKDGYVIKACGCGDRAEPIVLPKHGHTWGNVEYTWAEDYSSCTAHRKCVCTMEECKAEETRDSANVTSVTTPATCTEEGETVYTVAFVDEWAGTATKTVVIEIDEDAHDWDEGKVTAEPNCSKVGEKTFTCKHNAGHTYTKEIERDLDAHEWEVIYNWAEDHTACTAIRSCKNNAEHNITAEATQIISEVAKAPTCSAEGDTRYEAIFAEDWAPNSGLAVFGNIEKDPDAHTWDAGKVTKQPSYTEAGVMTYTCQNTPEGEDEHTKTEEIPVLEVKKEDTNEAEGPNGKSYYVDIKNGVLEPTSDAVKAEYPTASAIVEAFEEKIEECELDTEKGGFAIFEATIGYFDNAGKFVPASEEFFADGRTLKIKLPIPNGADKNDKFVIYHLNSETGNIDEYSTAKTGFYGIEVTNEDLIIEVNSLSPFAIAYESVANNNPRPSEPVEKDVITIVVPLDKAEESNPNTGAPVLCSFDLTAAGVVVLAATAAVLEIKRRK